MVPSSSAHWAAGSTTSASCAVSDRKKSATTSVSSARSRLSTWTASGAETARLKPITKSAADLAAESVEQLEGGLAAPGNRLSGTFQTSRDMAPGGRIVDPAVAGQLVGFLAVLAAALAVALAGQRAEPAAAGPAQAERERDIDVGERVSDALGLLFGPARRQHHRARGACPAGEPLRRASRSGTPVICSTRSGQYDAATPRASSKPSVRASMYARRSDRSRISTCSRPLASAASDPGRSGRCSWPRTPWRPPRIGDDQRSRRCLLRLEVLHQRRHRLGGIAADQQDRPPLRAMSSSGNGRPRSMPKARVAAAAADDMQKRPL